MRRSAAGLLLLLLAAAAGCDGVPLPAPPAPAATTSATPVPAAPLDPAGPRMAECLERNARGPGYDELAPRDARRKLRRLDVRPACEAELAR